MNKARWVSATAGAAMIAATLVLPAAGVAYASGNGNVTGNGNVCAAVGQHHRRADQRAGEPLRRLAWDHRLRQLRL